MTRDAVEWYQGTAAGLEARITAREEGTADFPMPTELIEFCPRGE